jgi:transcriptional regulator with PAS, ATPase and Fis domain
MDYETFRRRQEKEERLYFLSKIQDTKSVRLLANLLNISNTTLQRRLKDLGIVFQNKNKKGELNYEA